MKALLMAAFVASFAPAAQAQLLTQGQIDPSPSIIGELNSASFIQDSVAGLQFMIEASDLAEERLTSASLRSLAAAVRDAHLALAHDLIATMEKAGEPVPEGVRELTEPGYQRTAEGTSLDETLATELSALRETEDEDFERAYLTTMADGLESATRWWSAYAYRSENEVIRRFAELSMPTIRVLADAVQEARFRRGVSR